VKKRGRGDLDWAKSLSSSVFQVLPRRWVEQAFSWIDNNRQMSNDYEVLPETGEAFIFVAMPRPMAKRLAHL
jgi:putative transposase